MRLFNRLPACVVAVTAATAAAAGPLDQFSGRWAGWGRITTTSGASEKMKCVTTYEVSAGGTSATQKFRCASPSYRIDAIVNFTAKGKALGGDWRERIYAAGGRLRGTVNPGRIKMTLRSETFVTAVTIAASRCAQTIDIRPRGGIEVDSIRVELKRC